VNDNAKKWVDALRSGRFKQGRGSLRYDDSYCCLGVACQVYKEETGEGKWTPYDGAYMRFDLDDRSSFFILPQVVQEWLGLRTETGDFEETKTLTVLNDGVSPSGEDAGEAPFSFAEIADVIESEPEGLFLEVEE
jgi:hypothetical protein